MQPTNNDYSKYLNTDQSNRHTFAVIIILILTPILLFITLLSMMPSREGGAEGLLEKLKALDGVVSVEDYFLHEGTASFTLMLANNKSISLQSINNQDLVSSRSIVISGINGSNIICRSDGYGGMIGINVSAIPLPKDTDLHSLQNVLAAFDQIQAGLSSLPIEIKDYVSYSKVVAFICRDESKKNRSSKFKKPASSD